MDSKLQEAWSGPWQVVERMNTVNYKVKECSHPNRRPKIVHINTMKAFVERVEQVRRVIVVADDAPTHSVSQIQLTKRCSDFNQTDIDSIQDVLVPHPGNSHTVMMSIDVGDTPPIAQPPYNMLKRGVKEEIDGLVNSGIIVPSTSPWASPIVPVTKPDNSVRVCVDYVN